MNSRTFFSYSRSDSEFAVRLAADLRAAGADIWVDQLDIEAGARWDSSIEDALRRSARILVVLSPKAVTSQNVLDEVSFALDEGKAVVPVLVEPCAIPMRIRRLQYVDFTRDYEAALERLLGTLGVSRQSSSASPRTSAQPPPPEPANRDESKRKQALTGVRASHVITAAALVAVVGAAIVLWLRVPDERTAGSVPETNAGASAGTQSTLAAETAPSPSTAAVVRKEEPAIKSSAPAAKQTPPAIESPPSSAVAPSSKDHTAMRTTAKNSVTDAASPPRSTESSVASTSKNSLGLLLGPKDNVAGPPDPADEARLQVLRRVTRAIATHSSLSEDDVKRLAEAEETACAGSTSHSSCSSAASRIVLSVVETVCARGAGPTPPASDEFGTAKHQIAATSCVQNYLSSVLNRMHERSKDAIRQIKPG